MIPAMLEIEEKANEAAKAYSILVKAAKSALDVDGHDLDGPIAEAAADIVVALIEAGHTIEDDE